MKTLVISIANIISVTMCYGMLYHFEGGSVAHILNVEPYVNGNYTLNERILFINQNTNGKMVWDVDPLNMETLLLSFESNQLQEETRDYTIKCDPGGFGTEPFDLPVTVIMNTSSYASNEILGPFSISQDTLRIDVGYQQNVLHSDMTSQVVFMVNGETHAFDLTRRLDTYRAYSRPYFDDSDYPNSLALFCGSFSGSLDFQDYSSGPLKLFEIEVNDALVEFYLTDLFVRVHDGWNGIPIPEVAKPNGGEVLVAGTTYTITWQAIGATQNVFIEYSSDNGSEWIPVGTIENTGSHEWNVPLINSDECLIRITDSLNPSINDTSDAVFTIFECDPPILGDVNGDCYVNLGDVAIIALNWLKCGNTFDPNCQE